MSWADLFDREDIVYRTSVHEMENSFAKKRADGTLSLVHDETHVKAVSEYGAVTADALMRGQNAGDILAKKAALTTAISGICHDMEREAIETEPHGPASAERFVKILYSLKDAIQDTEMIDAIYRTIYNHEESFGEIAKIFGSPIGAPKYKVPSVTSHAMKTTDGALEGSGHRVVERRAFFVGKERMQEGKDLHGKLKYPDQSHLAVLGESQVRLYKRNPIDTYPAWLKNFAEELHGVQYALYRGLLHATGFSEAQAAEFFEKIGFPKMSKDLVEEIEGNPHLNGEHFDAEKYPVLTKKIANLNSYTKNDLDKLADATMNVIKIISTSDTPEDGVIKLSEFSNDNSNEHLVYFAGGISNYRNFSDSFKDSLHNFILKGAESSYKSLKSR